MQFTVCSARESRNGETSVQNDLLIHPANHRANGRVGTGSHHTRLKIIDLTIEDLFSFEQIPNIALRQLRGNNHNVERDLGTTGT